MPSNVISTKVWPSLLEVELRLLTLLHTIVVDFLSVALNGYAREPASPFADSFYKCINCISWKPHVSKNGSIEEQRQFATQKNETRSDSHILPVGLGASPALYSQSFMSCDCL